METGGDSPHLEPDYKDLEIIRQLDQTAFWINWENRAQRIAQAQLAAKPINRIRKFLKLISPSEPSRSPKNAFTPPRSRGGPQTQWIYVPSSRTLVLSFSSFVIFLTT
ncbi:hypothetical protein H4Q26_008584 [Puccinia striiformis f. sp. tritici PST-130]|nr:hypothetical protein H4Q26_008584 [Puccinia striiformis f. sp. tritici PST-130]